MRGETYLLRNSWMNRLRLERGFSYADIETVCRVTPSAVRNWMTGVTIPRYHHLRCLSWLFRVPVESLYEMAMTDYTNSRRGAILKLLRPRFGNSAGIHARM